jgi:hypothetical protein
MSKTGAMSIAEKTRENQLRRALARRGYRLQRTRRRDPHALDYGRYSLFELKTGRLRLDNLTLAEVVDIVTSARQIEALDSYRARRRRTASPS